MISGETMIFPVTAKKFRLSYRCLVSEHEYDLGICITMLREGSSFNQKRQQKNFDHNQLSFSFKHHRMCSHYGDISIGPMEECCGVREEEKDFSLLISNHASEGGQPWLISRATGSLEAPFISMSIVPSKFTKNI